MICLIIGIILALTLIIFGAIHDSLALQIILAFIIILTPLSLIFIGLVQLGVIS